MVMEAVWEGKVSEGGGFDRLTLVLKYQGVGWIGLSRLGLGIGWIMFVDWILVYVIKGIRLV